MGKPLVPDAPTSRDLLRWADKIVSYLRAAAVEEATPSPKIIQLEYKQTGAKATQDGILMWSPADGTVVVSKAGEWYKVTIIAGGTP